MNRPGLMADLAVEEDRQNWVWHHERAKSTIEPLTFETRIRTKAGETRWLDLVLSPVARRDGRSLGVRGSARDITAKKQSEHDLRRALEEISRIRDQLEADNTYLRERVHARANLDGVLGTSDVMRYVVARIHLVAPTPSTVLLLGETGVGKSLLAQAIHNLSPRQARPLVTLNCGALAPTLVESELFGHEWGAFTGAATARAGRFQIANGGTLFLDEIGELTLDLQAKLLRVVQDGTFVRLGSNVPLKADVRLIVATNRPLEDDVRAGRFRQDLWYRLNIFPITVPPLRQRPDDIPALARHFVEKHCRKLGRPIPDVSKATITVLRTHTWPGNVRELENVIERAVIVSRGSRLAIGVNELPAANFQSASRTNRSAVGEPVTLEELERQHIVATLERLHWRVEGTDGTAVALGINASTLRNRMRKLGIARPGSRPPVVRLH